MGQQLIFTSAVAGLNPGSSGYCTVARSEAIREAVVSRLEQWSVYTHGVGGKNPVVCAYRVLNLRGSVYHVLTRIVDSGLDYTGRTNFLAHHVVFQPHEVHGACSPAEVFLQWPGWMDQWQGGPRYLDDSTLTLHGIARSTRMPAGTWKEWAGDAGGATLLVTEVGGGGAAARPADLVVPAGYEAGLSNLYAESLHLIDPKGENAPAAWAVPFTTFLQTQDEPGDFRWVGLSPESRARASGEVLIDFAATNIPPVVVGGLAQYARTGMRLGVIQPMAKGGEDAIRSTNPVEQPVSDVIGFGTPRRLSTPQRIPASRQRGAPVAPREKIPAWVWFCTAGIVPVGLAAGLWIARPKDQGPPAKPAPTPIIAASTPAAEPSPSGVSPVVATVNTPFSAAPNLSSTPLAEPATPQKPSEEIFADHELAKLPDGPVYLTVGDVRVLKILPNWNNPFGDWLTTKGGSENKEKVKIEIRYDTLRQDTPVAAAFERPCEDHQFSTTDNPVYLFKKDEIRTSDGIGHDLVWITLGLPSAKYARIHFVLASKSNYLDQSGFHLSRRLFSKDANAPVFRMSEVVKQRLTKILESWIGLEPYAETENGRTVKYALRAILKNPAKGQKPYIDGNQYFELDFKQAIDRATSDVNEAQKKVQELNDQQQNESGMQKEVKERQERLLKPSPILPPNFPIDVVKDLSSDSYGVKPNMSGLAYYQTIHHWVSYLVQDDKEYEQEAQGFANNPPGGRFAYLRAALGTLKITAERQINKELKTNPPTISRNKKVQELATYLLERIGESDKDFINGDDNVVKPTEVLVATQGKLNDARANEGAAKQSLQTLNDFDHMDLCILAWINKSSVHLITFTNDEPAPTDSLAPEPPRTNVVPSTP